MSEELSKKPAQEGVLLDRPKIVRITIAMRDMDNLFSHAERLREPPGPAFLEIMSLSAWRGPFDRTATFVWSAAEHILQVLEAVGLTPHVEEVTEHDLHQQAAGLYDGGDDIGEVGNFRQWAGRFADPWEDDD